LKAVLDENMMTILSMISNVTVIIIVVFIAIRSLIDILKGVGFLPDKYYRLFYKGEEKRIKRLLNDIGVLPRKANFKTLTVSLDNMHLGAATLDQMKKEFSSIASQFIEKKELTVGSISKIRINHYLNLRKAFFAGNDMQLIELMAKFILYTAKRDSSVCFDCIVSRKSALDLLGYRLSTVLKVPFILCHDQPSIKRPDNEIEAFDHIPDEVRRPIIVDDSCAGGSSISNMVQWLRNEKLEVHDVFCFFILSTESIDKMKTMNIRLHFLEYFNEGKFEEVKG